MSVPRGQYRRLTRKGVQAPRTQAATEKASRGVGTDGARGRGYRPHTLKHRLKKASREDGTDDTRERGHRPHALKQQQDVKLNKLPARSVQATPAEGGTGPTHSCSDKY